MSEDFELEGELEGDEDDWAAPKKEGKDKKSGTQHHGRRHWTDKLSRHNDKSEKSNLAGKPSVTKDDKVQSAKTTQVPSTNSLLPKKSVDSMKSDPSEKNISKNSPDIGDIAGVIGRLDSSILKNVDANLKTQKDDKKTYSSPKIITKSSEVIVSSPHKRKNDDRTDSPKPKKSYNGADKGGSSKIGEDKEVKVLKQEEEKRNEQKDVKQVIACSEEESRNIDTDLVEEMIESAKKDIIPKNAEYTVRFSPVEIADLAEITLQKLVVSQSNLAFYFKRQGKFKKKKGYAEAYLTQLQEARIFIQKLLQIKLIERNIEVTFTVSRPKQSKEVLSLGISLNKNGPLLKIIQNSEDVTKITPGKRKEHLKVEKVPASVNTLLLRAIFPFAAEVIFPPEQKKTGYKGPINVNYSSNTLKEAVLECCSNFTYNGFTLPFEYAKKAEVPKTKSLTEIKKDGAVERRNSTADKNRQVDGSKTAKDGTSISGGYRSTTAVAQKDTSVDADISNMTLDVCTGMLESLSKLRQLGTDNPNIIKILEMQNELASLQKSLSKSTEQIQSDPWTVSASEEFDEQQNDSDEEQDKKLSKNAKKKYEKETKVGRQKIDMDDLQKIFEKAEEARIQEEERLKKQLEMEKEKIKEQEEKRKSSWARKLIEDAKQSSPLAGGDNTSSKEEAQRLLKIVGNKRKEAEEAKKLEEEAKARERARAKADENKKTKLETDQGANNALDDLIRALGHDPLSILQKGGVGAGPGKEDRINEEMDELVSPWSPNRNLHSGAPVYSEHEYAKLCSEYAGVIPWSHHIQIDYYDNRRCPVQSCPATKYFKTASSFDVHWDVFHKQNVTVKFCQKCNAYFTNDSELESHLTNRHAISDFAVVKAMSEEAREKVVSNPSYRDPGNYLPPLV